MASIPTESSLNASPFTASNLTFGPNKYVNNKTMKIIEIKSNSFLNKMNYFNAYNSGLQRTSNYLISLPKVF